MSLVAAERDTTITMNDEDPTAEIWTAQRRVANGCGSAIADDSLARTGVDSTYARLVQAGRPSPRSRSSSVWP